MSGMFRQSMTWLHTWAGLVFCWLLYFMFVTGTFGYFDTEIDRWMKPEFGVSAPAPATESVRAAQAHLGQVAPNAENWFIAPARGREEPHLRVFWRNAPAEEGAQPEFGNAALRVPGGEPIKEVRATGGGQTLYRMHYALHYFPRQTGFYIMAVVTMVMFVGLMTGVVAHKRIFADFFTFRWARGQRSWLDLHNLLAVATLPFQFMITYSGLLFTIFLWMPLVALGSYGFDFDRLSNVQEEVLGRPAVEASGTPASLVRLDGAVEHAEARWGEGAVRGVQVLHPGDANARVNVQRVGDFELVGNILIFDGVSGALVDEQAGYPNAPLAFGGTLIALHEGLFAGPALRWLYFLTGLLGAAMIAAGAIYWAVKRKPRTLGADVGFGYRFVEHMNVATIVGLLVAIAVYFWANRLLPLDLDTRAAWEVHCMFIAWGLCLLHTLVRPLARAWREQCWLLSGLCLGLPAVNALTTDVHLGATLAAGEWVLASFDLTSLASGVLAAVAAVHLGRRAARSPGTEAVAVRVVETPAGG